MPHVSTPRLRSPDFGVGAAVARGPRGRCWGGIKRRTERLLSSLPGWVGDFHHIYGSRGFPPISECLGGLDVGDLQVYEPYSPIFECWVGLDVIFDVISWTRLKFCSWDSVPPKNKQRTRAPPPQKKTNMFVSHESWWVIMLVCDSQKKRISHIQNPGTTKTGHTSESRGLQSSGNSLSCAKMSYGNPNCSSLENHQHPKFGRSQGWILKSQGWILKSQGWILNKQHIFMCFILVFPEFKDKHEAKWTSWNLGDCCCIAGAGKKTHLQSLLESNSNVS